MIMGIAERAGWDAAIAEATVPDNMTGNSGKIKDGIMDCTVKCFPVNRRWYWKIAVRNVTVTYIQKSTRSAISSQGPEDGTPYSWMHESITDRLRNHVGLGQKGVNHISPRQDCGSLGSRT